MRRLLMLLLELGFFLLLIKVIVLLSENRFAFFPDPHINLTPSAVNLRFEDVRFQAGDGVPLRGWYLPGPPGGPVILFFHGNAGNMGNCIEFVRFAQPLGASWFLFDYRGYGQSGGRISEAGFYRDADAAWQVCRERFCQDPARLFLWGFSIGSAGALHVAARQDVAGLILEAPLLSAAATAGENPILQFLYFFSSLSFDNATMIRRCSEPKLFIHGTQDTVIPPSHSQALYRLAPPPADLYLVEGANHNNLFLVGDQPYLERVGRFMREHCAGGLPPAAAPAGRTAP